MTINRRGFLSVAAATAVAPLLSEKRARAGARPAGRFPAGFLWGASTAGQQIEGNNVSSDCWLAENVRPTIFSERSGDADNSLELWPVDLDLVRGIGLNAYRFSLEWARIEPEPGMFSVAMLDHYQAIVEGCRGRGIAPVVTFSHDSVPWWFAARGGWTQPDAPGLFARFCERAARHLAQGIAYALTLNEPNDGIMVRASLPEQFVVALRATNQAAGRACGSPGFRLAILPEPAQAELAQSNLLSAHKAGRAAIKAARSDLPVGFSLALPDDEAVGPHSLRNAMRAEFYGPWLEIAKHDDFLGVQNYDRVRWSDTGRLPLPPGAIASPAGNEVYAPSLARAVRYAHRSTGVPILVTEHGICTDDDALRAKFIAGALTDLQGVIAEGVPVRGYMHWTLMDDWEWFAGYSQRYGLCNVDRLTFKRTPKPSAGVLGAIARRNAV